MISNKASLQYFRKILAKMFGLEKEERPNRSSKDKRFFFLKIFWIFSSPELGASFDPGIMQKFYSTRLISSLWEQDKRAYSSCLVSCSRLGLLWKTRRRPFEHLNWKKRTFYSSWTFELMSTNRATRWGLPALRRSEREPHRQEGS